MMKIEITNDKLQIKKLIEDKENQKYFNDDNLDSYYKKEFSPYASIGNNKITAICALEERKWDTLFFKRKMGLINIVLFVESPVEDLKKLLKIVLQQAEVNNFKHIILRVKNYEYNLIRAVESNDFKLVDSGTILITNLDKISEINVYQDKNVREMLTSDLNFIQDYIASLFKHSYFYRDNFFSLIEADNLFKTWLHNCFTQYSEKVFVYEYENKAVGFVTCSVDSDRKGHIPLVGVHQGYSGRGIATAILRSSLKWYFNNGIKNIDVKTQSQNIAAINLYIKNNFTLDYVDCTYTKTLK